MQNITHAEPCGGGGSGHSYADFHECDRDPEMRGDQCGGERLAASQRVATAKNCSSMESSCRLDLTQAQKNRFAAVVILRINDRLHGYNDL